MTLVYLLVGDEGFEPPVPDSESGALPLGESPTCLLSYEHFLFFNYFDFALRNLSASVSLTRREYSIPAASTCHQKIGESS